MKRSDDFIENRLRWRATKNGLPKASSFFFEDLVLSEKLRYKDELEPYKIGKPVLIFLGENGTWTIFGTLKVISGVEQSFECVSYSKIDKLTFGDDPLQVFLKSKNLKEFVKEDQHQILVCEKGGRIVTLNGPKGYEFYIMYNILLMVNTLMKD